MNRALGEVAADLHHPVDPDRGGRRAIAGRQVRRGLAVAGDVEVGVVVHDRDRQRVGGRRRPVIAARPAGIVSGTVTGRLRRRHRPSRASSSSTTDGSSLVKTGVGLATGVADLTGRDSQRGVAE